MLTEHQNPACRGCLQGHRPRHHTTRVKPQPRNRLPNEHTVAAKLATRHVPLIAGYPKGRSGRSQHIGRRHVRIQGIQGVRHHTPVLGGVLFHVVDVVPNRCAPALAQRQALSITYRTAKCECEGEVAYKHNKHEAISLRLKSALHASSGQQRANIVHMRRTAGHI